MRITIDNLRLFYAHNLFEASVVPNAGPDAKPKFSFEGALEKSDPQVEVIRQAVIAEALREWGGTGTEADRQQRATAALKAVHSAGNVWVLRDGDDKLDKEGNTRKDYTGKMLVCAKNEIRPTLLAGGPDGRAPTTKDDGKLYSGCYVRAIIDVKAGSKPKRQVYAYLLGVQKMADGERIGAGVATAEDFQPLANADSKKPEIAKKGAAALF